MKMKNKYLFLSRCLAMTDTDLWLLTLKLNLIYENISMCTHVVCGLFRW